MACTGTSCTGACIIACNAGCGGGCTGACVFGCGSGCSGACLGSCLGTCKNLCAEGCVLTCSFDCTNGCGSSCSNNCTTGCSGTCKNGCTSCTSCTGTCDGCSGCSGCSGCGGSCSYNCSSCTGTCKGDCNNGCSSANSSEIIANLGANIVKGNKVMPNDFLSLRNAIRKELIRRGKTVPNDNFLEEPASGKTIHKDHLNKVMIDVKVMDPTKNIVRGDATEIKVVSDYIKTLMSQNIK